MSRLRFPLKRVLQDPVDEAALHRIADRVDSRLRARSSTNTRGWVAAAAVCVVAAVVAVFALSLVRRTAGPLALADGSEFRGIEATAMREVRLSDGSVIGIWPGASVEPLESTATTFWAAVKRGRVDFEVRPGGPRRWTIECGLASVEVVGTGFTCDREPGRLSVSVRHGVVLARGDRVPDRVRRLTAGESLEIDDRAASVPALPSSAPVGPTSASAEPRKEESLLTRKPPTSVRTWRELARGGHNAEAYAALGTDGVRRESKQLGVNDLLALADVARLSGHPAEAVTPLQRILSEFSGDAQAPLAAFALGRIELDSLGRARAAATAFNRALALGIPHDLREDVLQRLVEACTKGGDSAAARRAKDAYLTEFPNGRYARAFRESQR